MFAKDPAINDYSKPSRAGAQQHKRRNDGEQRAEKAARRDRKARINRVRERELMND